MSHLRLVEPETDRPSRHVVYFVQQGLSGPIKIGYTHGNLRSRLSALRTSSAVPLNLLLAIPGDRTVEREWHQRFADIRMAGEWFQPTLALLMAVDDSCQSRRSA